MSRYRLPGARGQNERRVLKSRIGDRQSASTPSITVNKRATVKREWSRVHQLVAIVSLLINDALDAREANELHAGKEAPFAVVAVVLAVERKNVNR